MNTRVTQFPDLQTLTDGLSSVFSSNQCDGVQVTIVDRLPNVYMSTFSTEIVTCRFAGGRQLQLFCKYGHSPNHSTRGQRDAIEYEGEVYRSVLRPLGTPTVKFYGNYLNRASGEVWLILDYLAGSSRIHRTRDARTEGTAVSLAASWIGRFHAVNEARLLAAPAPFLRAYSARYYLGWAQRTMRFAGHLQQSFPWLASACEGFEEYVIPLLTARPTLIHGEYFPCNVLFQRGTVYPVDWESAAIGPGEIDLASLTDGFWPVHIVGQCEDEYRRARWPAGAPREFEQSITAAQAYWQFRCLGDRRDLTTHEGSLWRFQRLRSVSERLGLI
ncbi:MAG TPA: phosphotransferase [Dehalococcoidia bacterium]|nr:phosphotransferase [Dehalococcoidia bacterium]